MVTLLVICVHKLTQLYICCNLILKMLWWLIKRKKSRVNTMNVTCHVGNVVVAFLRHKQIKITCFTLIQLFKAGTNEYLEFIRYYPNYSILIPL